VVPSGPKAGKRLLANEVPMAKEVKLLIKASMAHKRKFKGVSLSEEAGSARAHPGGSKGF
jgi:hypothetical protein